LSDGLFPLAEGQFVPLGKGDTGVLHELLKTPAAKRGEAFSKLDSLTRGTNVELLPRWGKGKRSVCKIPMDEEWGHSILKPQ
jgi:hypothetical protein